MGASTCAAVLSRGRAYATHAAVLGQLRNMPKAASCGCGLAVTRRFWHTRPSAAAPRDIPQRQCTIPPRGRPPFSRLALSPLRCPNYTTFRRPSLMEAPSPAPSLAPLPVPAHIQRLWMPLFHGRPVPRPRSGTHPCPCPRRPRCLRLGSTPFKRPSPCPCQVFDPRRFHCPCRPYNPRRFRLLLPNPCGASAFASCQPPSARPCRPCSPRSCQYPALAGTQAPSRSRASYLAHAHHGGRSARGSLGLLRVGRRGKSSASTSDPQPFAKMDVE